MINSEEQGCHSASASWAAPGRNRLTWSNELKEQSIANQSRERRMDGKGGPELRSPSNGAVGSEDDQDYRGGRGTSCRDATTIFLHRRLQKLAGDGGGDGLVPSLTRSLSPYLFSPFLSCDTLPCKIFFVPRITRLALHGRHLGGHGIA